MQVKKWRAVWVLLWEMNDEKTKEHVSVWFLYASESCIPKRKLGMLGQTEINWMQWERKLKGCVVKQGVGQEWIGAKILLQRIQK